MSRSPFIDDDDDYDYKKDDYDEDLDGDDDDDEEGSSTNPYSARPPAGNLGNAGVRGAGLPTPARPPTPPSGSNPNAPSGGNAPASPLRTQGSPFSTPSVNNPSGGGQGNFGSRPQGGSAPPSGGGGSNVQPFQRPPLGSSGGASQGTGQNQFPQRPQERPQGGTPPSGGDRRPEDRSGTAAFPRPGDRPNEPRRDEPRRNDNPGGGFGSRPAGREDEGRSTPSSSANARPTAKPEPKKDDAGSAFNRLTQKLGGNDKPPAKPATPAKADDKGGAGGALGKIGGLFGRGDKPDAKPAPKAPAPSAPSSPSSSSAGGASFGGNRPGFSGSSASGSAPASRTTAPPAAPAKGNAKPAKKESGGLFSRIAGLNPFAPRPQSKTARAARTGASVSVKPMTMSLDKKLEIVGIVMVISAIVLLLSSLSPTQGAITQEVNEFLSRLFGWGAIAVPIAMIPVGIWLISLRVGQETPMVDVSRVFGTVLLYLCALTLFQFINALDYPPGQNQTYQEYLAALRNALLPLAAEFGRGGGQLGGNLYYLLISNFSEVAGFVILLGVMAIALMFTLSISAQEVVAIVVGNTRNLRDAQRRRSERLGAQRAEREAVLAVQREAAALAAGASVTVTKPDAAALPAGKVAALPTPALAALPEPKAEERSIAITMGGRTVSAQMRAESVPVEGTNAATSPTPVRRAADEKPGGVLGGFGARLRNAVPTLPTVSAAVAAATDALTPDKDTPDNKAEKQVEEKAGRGGIGGRFFNRSVSKPADDGKPVVATATPPLPTATSPTTVTPATASALASATATPTTASAAALVEPATADKPLADTAAPSRSAAVRTPADGSTALSTNGGSGTAEKPAGIGRSPSLETDGRAPERVTPAPQEVKTEAAKPVSPEMINPAVSAEKRDRPPRLGDLMRGAAPAQNADQPAATSTPERVTPSSANPARPSVGVQPFQRPPLGANAAPKESSVSGLGSNAKAGDEPRDKAQPQPVVPAASRPSPFETPVPPKPLEREPHEPDEDAPENWAKLPPAQPKRTGEMPAPNGGSQSGMNGNSLTRPAPAPKPSEIPDLQSRLAALRAMPATDDEAASEAVDEPRPNEERRSGVFGAVVSSTPTPPRPAAPSPLPADDADLDDDADDADEVDDFEDEDEIVLRPGARLNLSPRDGNRAGIPPFGGANSNRPTPPLPVPPVKSMPERPVPTPNQSPSEKAGAGDVLKTVAGIAGTAAIAGGMAAADAAARLLAKDKDEAKPSTPSSPAPSSPTNTPPTNGTLAGSPPPPAPPARSAAPLPTTPSPAASAPSAPAAMGSAPPASSFGRPDTPPVAGAMMGRGKKDWRLPDHAALLTPGLDQELNHDALLKRAHTIEETLNSFGAPGKVVEVRTGPVVTQFGVEPDYVSVRGKKNRVKVSQIAALDKDLQLSLGAKSIRIEAPVPGKGYVGIEVPNDSSTVVRLRDLLESDQFRHIKGPLPIALGQSVDGTPVAADLASMPHMLIAGTTGSGKSVCVNTIIASLLVRNSPDRVKFIMVDPKRVELTGYNGIPHLIAPVVVELERVVSVLKWVTREMDERYRRFSLAAARNIEDFNKHLPQGEPPLPYIVVIIDELADLMMMAPDDTERLITRIAALARATGIHLVIATQRPSVDVVTGLIKANFPARVAFAVAGSVDSRVILDQPGAEKLLGRGDMLFMSGDAPAPARLQGVYVSDTEISNITRFWRQQVTDADLQAVKPMISAFTMDEEAKNGNSKNWTPMGAKSKPNADDAFGDDEDDDNAGSNDGEDALYDEAVEMVRRVNKASVSLLQRRFRIGYTRAARLMDMMEERGIVGPPVEGSKPREVLPRK